MRLLELLQGVVLAGSRAAAAGRAFNVVQLPGATFVRSCDDASPAHEAPIARVMPSGDVFLMPTRPTDPDAIPFPPRPGTIWQAKQGVGGYSLNCANCGRGYTTHGAPEGTAAELGLPLDTPRHLICRWSDDAWNEYNRERRRASVAGFVHDIEADLQKFGPDDQRTILYLISQMQPSAVSA